eukprot:8664905-Pyramimonas_sp.AAC.1
MCIRDRGVGTTQAFDPESTTNVGDVGPDDLTDGQMEMMCAMYPLFRCAIEQPSQCGGGILLGGSGDVPDLTTDELAQLEE